MLGLCTLDLETHNQEWIEEPPQQNRAATQEELSYSKILLSRKGAIISVATNVGKRDENLDKFAYQADERFQLIAVFDGHGNSTVSNYLQTYLLKALKSHPLLLINFEVAIAQTFKIVDNQLLNILKECPANTGSTALVVLITQNQFFVASLGDSRALSITRQGEFLQLNTQHNLQNQNQRQLLIQRGGIVVKKGKGYRLAGEINVSRAFGDFKYKPVMSEIAQVKRFCRHNTKYLVLGSDGFWGQTTNSRVNELIEQQCQNKAKMLMQQMGKKWSDNSTVVCYQMAQSESEQSSQQC